MHYELYVDSIFLLNFMMNLYLLRLVNGSVLRSATRLRCFLCATLGAAGYLLPFVLHVPFISRILIGGIVEIMCLIVIPFRVKNMKSFGCLLEKISIYALLLGGGVVFLNRVVRLACGHELGVLGMINIGSVIFLLIRKLQEKKKTSGHICKVTLMNSGSKIIVKALIDSGNSLVEPISGKPVSIIEKKLFQSLWPDDVPLYRAVPYHSIGKKHGILLGYLLPEMWVELDGAIKVIQNAYVAVAEEQISGEQYLDEQEHQVKMILNPQLLQNG